MLNPICCLFQAANPHASIPMIKNWTKNTLSNFPQFCWVIKKDGAIIGAVAGLIIRIFFHQLQYHQYHLFII